MLCYLLVFSISAYNTYLLVWQMGDVVLVVSIDKVVVKVQVQVESLIYESSP